MSTRFLSDPKVERLGEKHGTAGPLFLVSLLIQAGLQESGGKIERSFRATAHELFLDREKVEEILDDAIEYGLCHAVSRDVTGYLVELPAWERHQAAYRKAKSRAAQKTADKPHEQADVTGSHAESRDVTNNTRQDNKKKRPPSEEEAPLSYLLAELVAANGSKRPTVTRTWADEEDRMLRLDGRTPKEAKRLIEWCQRSSFWRANVRSMPKFREQYDTMRLQAIAEKEGKPNGGPSTDTLARMAERAA